MKARRKSDGKIIKVEEAVYNMKTGEPCHKCLSDGHHYSASDLDFNVGAEETVIQGWVARDKGGFISLFSYCPDRVIHDDLGFWGHNDGSDEIDLPKSSFPDITWDSAPEPVEIIIKRKKNG